MCFKIDTDKLHDECGIFGIYKKNAVNISNLIYFGLVTLQHRGQESTGIAVYDGSRINYYKEMGLVREAFNEKILQRLQGDIAIGHVRYSSLAENYIINAQPLVVQHKGGALALAHNGTLINAQSIREELEDKGAIFQTQVDTEVIANLIAKYYKYGFREALKMTLESVKGAYAILILMGGKLVGVRDPLGLRPLCIGELEDGYVLSSESCGLSVIGAKFIRDVKPGEIVIIDDKGIESISFIEEKKKAHCSFEYVYFARPDSILDERSVYRSRIEAGKILAREHPADADVVIAVPDSGTVAAIGYAEESGIPFREGLIKNKYLGRTFIQPDQQTRELSVMLKLSVLEENVKGKRIVLVDDSIVRGTTSKRILNMLRKAGAKEIHVRISSPTVKYPCYFGIDTPSRKQLVAAHHDVEEIRKSIGADTLGFLSLEGLKASISMGDDLCLACFNGDYPMDVPGFDE